MNLTEITKKTIHIHINIFIIAQLVDLICEVLTSTNLTNYSITPFIDMALSAK